MAQNAGQLREFVQLVQFANGDGSDVVDAQGQQIHMEYMQQFGGAGAFTIAFLKLTGRWHWLVRYKGPEESAGWLESRISSAARAMNNSVEIVTLGVEADMTERF